ncbi:uncharacterized protein J3D65DRAFT_549986 [Phyllosticta citribraziliensis]|uniref:Proteasome assembly chaperone 3 n=1 Tax=Phyllosticta citribraziliensis TaxID=989973 RepID=A0ABR1LXR9_9PEZI
MATTQQSQPYSFPVQPEAFPAKTRSAAGPVDGVPTNVMVVQFEDKILVTISQAGRLAHWAHVPLSTLANASLDPTAPSLPPSTYADDADYDPLAPQNHDSSLLPLPQLTATPILGGGSSSHNSAAGDVHTITQLVATQVASAIATRDTAEGRLVVVGAGWDVARARRESDGCVLGKEGFLDVVGLVVQCL